MEVKPFSIVPDTVKLGIYSTIWSFTVVEDYVDVGENVVIGSHCYIGAWSKIGNGSRIQTGVFLPRHTWIGENVFIGPHVCCTDDKYPQVNNVDYLAAPPFLESGSAIGAGALLLPGIRIGKNAMVGAGAVVLEDVPENGVVVGNPSRIIKIKEGESHIV